jgi:hypothetical protein
MLMERSQQSRFTFIVQIPSFAGGEYTIAVLGDSGASFSCISLQLVRRLGLDIVPPVGNAAVGYANVGLQSKRIGKVELPITLHFPDEPSRPTAQFNLWLEVFDTAYDFIFGVDVLVPLYPNDISLRYGVKKAQIARDPTNMCSFPRDERLISAYNSRRVNYVNNITDEPIDVSNHNSSSYSHNAASHDDAPRQQ